MSNKLLSTVEFLKKYNLFEDQFVATGLRWTDLEAIYIDHVRNTGSLQPAANFIGERLQQVSDVHSLKVRIKNPEH